MEKPILLGSKNFKKIFPLFSFPPSAIQILSCLVGVLALIISAKISFYMGLVPFTMQTFVVLMLSAFLGKRLGFVSVVSYLVAGLVGFPVFASSLAGPMSIFTPSFGYILGFLVSVTFINACFQKDQEKSFFLIFLIFLLADLFILVSGMCYLSFFVSPAQAVKTGFVVFLLPEMLKITLASLLVFMKNKTKGLSQDNKK